MKEKVENEKLDWLNRMHTACEAIRNCTSYMEHLSWGFRITGNHMIGDEIDELIKQINQSQETIYHGIGEKVSEQLHDSEQATYNMFGAVLNGLLTKTQ